MNKNIRDKKILIAPLDWGLGHATRCLVIIKKLELLGCNITIAASGKVEKLLKAEFPHLAFLHLPGYNISYSKSKRSLALKILIQIPKIIKIIRFENKWLKRVTGANKFDVIISDNRYGLYSKKNHSVFITHQLHIKTNKRLLDHLLQMINYKYINRFNECWIPDFEDDLNIAGELSHPSVLPSTPLKYIGPVSRFNRALAGKITFKWIVLISGPEPQRSIFEKKIIEAASKTNEKFAIVRGLPGEAINNIQLPNCTVFNHLTTADMQAAINESEFVVSRCGYTTVMEILSLQKKSVLVPTPGQTEQEYLAQHLSKQNWCYAFNQNEDFVWHLDKAKTFNYTLPQLDMNLYEAVLENFVNAL